MDFISKFFKFNIKFNIVSSSLKINLEANALIIFSFFNLSESEFNLFKALIT